MRNSFIILFFIISSCQNNAAWRQHATPITIELIDSLGIITMNRPVATDTFFYWIRLNDCGKPCEEGKYRFQSKASRIYKESGSYWTGQPKDSVYQLTISHLRPDTLVNNDELFAIKAFDFFKERLKSDPETKDIISDTNLKIGDRQFAIFKVASDKNADFPTKKRLIAVTSVSGNDLWFYYDLLGVNKEAETEAFFNNCFQNLQSVRIKDAR